MEAALRAFNQLVADGVIGNYAVGGAIGAAFYIKAAQTEDIKAAQTEDLDVFVFLPASASELVLRTPVYDALTALGGVVEREYVRFGEWPVQILTDANPLIADALREAPGIEYQGAGRWGGGQTPCHCAQMILLPGSMSVVVCQVSPPSRDTCAARTPRAPAKAVFCQPDGDSSIAGASGK